MPHFSLADLDRIVQSEFGIKTVFNQTLKTINETLSLPINASPDKKIAIYNTEFTKYLMLNKNDILEAFLSNYTHFLLLNKLNQHILEVGRENESISGFSKLLVRNAASRENDLQTSLNIYMKNYEKKDAYSNARASGIGAILFFLALMFSIYKAPGDWLVTFFGALTGITLVPTAGYTYKYSRLYKQFPESEQQCENILDQGLGNIKMASVEFASRTMVITQEELNNNFAGYQGTRSTPWLQNILLPAAKNLQTRLENKIKDDHDIACGICLDTLYSDNGGAKVGLEPVNTLILPDERNTNSSGSGPYHPECLGEFESRRRNAGDENSLLDPSTGSHRVELTPRGSRYFMFVLPVKTNQSLLEDKKSEVKIDVVDDDQDDEIRKESNGDGLEMSLLQRSGL